MKTPILITNFKATETAIGESAEKMAEIHAEISREKNVEIAVAPQNCDLFRVAQNCEIPVFAQHCDAISCGSFTGKTPAKILKINGAAGVILNHSENRFSNFDDLKTAAEFAKKENLKIVICAETADEGAEIMKNISPDFVAVEPPELIGGEISVSTARPELISESVAKIGAGKVLVGAGVKNSADVKIALKLGAVGILVASGVTKNENPRAAILDLVSAF